MLIGNVRKNGLNHFINKKEVTLISNNESKTAIRYTTMCNTFVADWWHGDKEPLNLREWGGQRICVSCALIAYKMELVDLVPDPRNNESR